MKRKIRNIRNALLKLTAAGILSLLFLSAFNYIYNFTGIHIVNPSGATDYTWLPNQYKANMTEGFAWLHMDANGFNNAYVPAEDEIDILLMGGSHMEAVVVGGKENVGYLLNQYLDDLYTYNIGMSGHVIYVCVQNLEAALEKYSPSDFVVIETGTVQLDADAMTEALEGTYSEIPSYDSGLLYLIQKRLPVIKTLYKQMDDWISLGLNACADDAGQNESELSGEADDGQYRQTLEAFIQKISTTVSERRGGVKTIILYQPMIEVDADGNCVMLPEEQRAREQFAEICDEQGIIFVDMTDDFLSLYEEKHVLTHGFVNTKLGAGHLNKYGHEACAKALAETIRSLEEEE